MGVRASCGSMLLGYHLSASWVVVFHSCKEGKASKSWVNVHPPHRLGCIPPSKREKEGDSIDTTSGPPVMRRWSGYLFIKSVKW